MGIQSSHEDQRPSLLSVSIRGYKNLGSVDLPWSRVGVLFGPNGAGKTNILECLALLFGTNRTLALARDRATLPEPRQLTCTALVSERRLPLPPDVARKLRDLPDFAARADADLNWWARLGASAGTTMREALNQSDIAEPARQALIDECAHPTVTYSLSSMHDYNEKSRLFTPAWLIPASTSELRDALATITNADGHQHEYPAHPHDDRVAVPLPLTTEGPARLEWLSRQRQSEEVTEDLLEAFEQALPAVDALAQRIGFLLTTAEVEPEPTWWLHETAAARASDELQSTIGSVLLRSRGADNADWTIIANGGERSSTLDENFLSQLSSAERRWTDEALASAARAMSDQGRRNQWQEFFWSQAEDALDDATLEELAGTLADTVSRDDYVSGEVLERVAKLLDRQLVEVARSWFIGDRTRSEMTTALIPTIADLVDPPITIRAFDEPEAHLHPTGQRQVRDALTSMGRAGEDVIISTHSPYLLSQREWTYTKVINGSAAPLVASDLAASNQFAAEVGLTTGELLANARLVLIVEGKHDEFLLRELYGEELDDAGVVVLPMHGTWNAMALLESEFWLRYSGIGFTVMFDNSRLSEIDSNARDERLRPEEKALRTLQRTARERGRKLRRVGLEWPDITAYLSEELFRDNAQFPGWEAVVAAYRRGPNSRFKEFVQGNYNIRLGTEDVQRYVKAMRTRGMRPASELERKISQVCASTTARALETS